MGSLRVITDPNTRKYEGRYRLRLEQSKSHQRRPPGRKELCLPPRKRADIVKEPGQKDDIKTPEGQINQHSPQATRLQTRCQAQCKVAPKRAWTPRTRAAEKTDPQSPAGRTTKDMWNHAWQRTSSWDLTEKLREDTLKGKRVSTASLWHQGEEII